MTSSEPAPEGTTAHRRKTLHELEAWLERPMLVLSLVWLALFVLEFTRGLPPLLTAATWCIWAAFVGDFVLRLALAPDRSEYLRANWLTAISLLVPAVRLLRVVRVLQAARAARVLRAASTVRGLRLVKVVGSLNRGMRALGRSFRRRGFGYVVALTGLVTLGGAAAMFAFERDVPDSPLTSFGGTLWWTAMMMTTMGSDYFPRSPEAGGAPSGAGWPCR